MTGWCPYLPGRLDQAECHFDGYCEECPHYKRFNVIRCEKQWMIDTFVRIPSDFKVIRFERTMIANTPGGRQFADEYEEKLIRQDAFYGREENEEYITIMAEYSFMLGEDE